jgi:hypothetical protein
MFLIAYSFVFTKLIKRLKVQFPNFYQKERKRILSVGFLMFSSICVVIFGLLLNSIDAIDLMIIESFH